MFNLMAVVINKQMNKVFYCFDPNFARNISIIAGNIEINIIADNQEFKIFLYERQIAKEVACIAK